MNPHSHPPKAQGWDPVWEDVFSSQAWGRYPPEPVVREISRAFGKTPDRSQIRILDLGCGPGANVWFVAREGYTAAGLDGSTTAIRIAGERLAAEGLAADLKLGDFTQDLPWADESFDAVIDCAALYSNPLTRIREAVTEIHRVLKPKGRLISMSFTDRTWGYGTGEPGEEPGGYRKVDAGPLAGKGYVHFFSRAEVDGLYAAFPLLKVERASYTLENGDQLIEYWVVSATK